MQKGVEGFDCFQKEAEVKEDSPFEKQRMAKLKDVPKSAGPGDEEWGSGIYPTSRKPSRRDGRTRQPHLQQQTEREIHDAQSHGDVEDQDVPPTSRLIQGRTVEALVDTGYGASRSLIVPSLVTELAMGTSALYPHVYMFKVASGEDFVVRLAVEGVAFVVGSLQSYHDFLVAQVPHKMIHCADWLWKENVIWDFKERTLCIKKHNNVHRLLCEDYGQGSTHTATENSRQLMLEGYRRAATEAHQQMASAVRRMGAEMAAALTVEDKSAGIEEVCAAAKDTHMKINAGSAYGEAPAERVKMSEDYGELEVVAHSRKKDDGSGKQQYRMGINYQELNAITISPEYPLPRIQDILDLLHGVKAFSTMEMEQRFHQIRMAPEDQHKTAFRTCMGQYEFKMYPKFKKCQFGTSSIEYLGYRIVGDGITPSPAKIKAFDVWPEELHNDTQVKQFLGTVNYCRMFMGPAFADMARSLVEITKKDAPFVWTGKHTAAVEALKHTLVNYTTLQTPDAKKPYLLRTDAPGYAVGSVLEQDGKPLGFMCMKMSPAEQRYPVYDQELLALIRALEKWRQRLLVPTVIAYTDHRALQYLTKMKTTKPIRPRVARWLEFLMD
ncbi:hypothetical protein EBH_0069490, partial [Eimeria brunetti]